MDKKELSASHHLDRRDFLTGIGGIAAVAATTPSFAEIAQVAPGQNTQPTTATTALPNGRLKNKVAVVSPALPEGSAVP